MGALSLHHGPCRISDEISKPINVKTHFSFTHYRPYLARMNSIAQIPMPKLRSLFYRVVYFKLTLICDVNNGHRVPWLARLYIECVVSHMLLTQITTNFISTDTTLLGITAMLPHKRYQTVFK